ncbi:NAD-dependent epimerase/dehydratase family protein [Ferruginivarius sediminum]|uniref:NAD-dependent epimerase/dehydratase family protein n=1 Tax=Ferruginivarius sediminum TaxID=2661937 RepID=A0A369T468_9PROT|nr:NAD-dependent epimerase/dehydratase family protein [Ferruginivarius sediminum]RDD60140.1 NAD-dependent epimerase/dehydratase family protein [Ferruginivarius sediminum]
MSVFSEFQGSRILVVGGAGFVGSNLCRRVLESRPKELIVVDNLLSADSTNVPRDSAVTFVHGSITYEKVLCELPANLDYVFHLATYHGNQSSIHDPLMDHENNTLTTLKLFNRLAHMKSVKKVVYASAGCTVAEKTYEARDAVDEDASISLYHDTPYQISKLIGEFYANYYFLRAGLPVVKARFQNVYGPGEILGAGRWRGTEHTIWRNVVPTFIWKALGQEALPVDNGGVATRDFVYVDDIVEGLIACALNGGAGEVYNLASGVETSIRDLAEKINALTQNPKPLDIKPARDWDRSGRRYGSTRKAHDKLGFQARVDLDTGLARTIEWTFENSDLIRRCIAQHGRFLQT